MELERFIDGVGAGVGVEFLEKEWSYVELERCMHGVGVGVGVGYSEQGWS